MTAIALSDVVKDFPTGDGPVRAVDHVNLMLDPGEVVAFLGPNGAGKSTCIDMMLGLTDPTHGTVQVHGGSPRAAVQAGRIGAILQSGGLLDDLTVHQTLTMIATLHPGRIDLDTLMRRTNLTPLASRRVSHCSGGERQRLRFALALIPDPDILILDEPTAGMDVNARAEFWATTHQEAANGQTVLFATHYLKEAQDFADRIILIAEGRIVADGTVDEIRRLGAGRSVSAHWPGWTPDVSLPGVTHHEREGERVRWWADDSDALALHLLTSTAATDLEITTADLDSAFAALTRTTTTGATA